MNLFAMCKANIDHLRSQYALIEKQCTDQAKVESLGSFVGAIKESYAISINIKPAPFKDLLVTGKYKNAYEISREKGPDPEEALRRHLKEHYGARATFDNYFDCGEEFKYGAMNIGGIGATKYGPFCVILKRENSDGFSSMAFVREDSLKYVENSGVDIERLSQDVADRESVHLLAALKHETDIESVPANEWPRICCCDSCYIEAITRDDIVCEHFESARMSREE